MMRGWKDGMAGEWLGISIWLAEAGKCYELNAVLAEQ